jgi:hypothetical protein
MAAEKSHLTTQAKPKTAENPAPRLHHFYIVPTLIGTLAVVNVASVVLALLE